MRPKAQINRQLSKREKERKKKKIEARAMRKKQIYNYWSSFEQSRGTAFKPAQKFKSMLCKLILNLDRTILLRRGIIVMFCQRKKSIKYVT